MTRGNNRTNIFIDKEDFENYLEILKNNKEKYGFKVYHYVIMNNHVHLIMWTKTGEDLSNGMRRIGVMYSSYYRRKYKGVGHVFQDRFKSFIIQEGKYLLECGRYVELNPVRAGIVKMPLEYKWSSYGYYMETQKTNIVDNDPEYLGLSEEPEKRKDIYREYVERGEFNKTDEDRYFKKGVYGSDNFWMQLKVKGLESKRSNAGRPKRK